MASRLEGLNKQLGTNILLTRDLQKTIEAHVVTPLVGHFRFKGFDKVTEVYELISATDSAQTPQPWQATFEKALQDFQRKAFDAAIEGFRQTLVLKPHDGPSEYYLARISELQIHAPAAEWMGEIHLLEK